MNFVFNSFTFFIIVVVVVADAAAAGQSVSLFFAD